MDTFYKKIEQVKSSLIEQKGNFTLFALVKLKVSPKKWDVIVCADWLPKKEIDAIRFIAEELKKTLIEDDFLYLSGIVVLNKTEPVVEEIRKLINSEKPTILKNKKILHLSIKEIRVLQQYEAKEDVNILVTELQQPLLKIFIYNNKIREQLNIIPYNQNTRIGVCQSQMNYNNYYQ